MCLWTMYVTQQDQTSTVTYQVERIESALCHLGFWTVEAQERGISLESRKRPWFV
jgi:hypothetical protein